MKIIFVLTLLISTFLTNAQTVNPFLSLKFDKVVMYDFEGGKGLDLFIVNKKGELANSIKKQIQLSNATVEKLNVRLGQSNSFGSSTASCFDPHLGFVYFLKNNIVAHITISLDCRRLYSSIEIPAQRQGKVGEGDDAFYMAEGLSKLFRNFLNSLMAGNNFSHQIE